MSTLETLAARGLTQDDLVKMASARLFVQECAADGIDLDKLASADQDKLYQRWCDLKAGKTASAPAAVEAVTDTAAKIAEMDILGRHLATVFVGEVNKQAAAGKLATVNVDKPSMASHLTRAGMMLREHAPEAVAGTAAVAAGAGFGAGRASKGSKKESQVVVDLNKVANWAKTRSLTGGEKCANAYEEAVCANIYSKLAAANYDVSAFHTVIEVEVPADKTASAEEVDAAIEESAVATLKNLGFQFQA